MTVLSACTDNTGGSKSSAAASSKPSASTPAQSSTPGTSSGGASSGGSSSGASSGASSSQASSVKVAGTPLNIALDGLDTKKQGWGQGKNVNSSNQPTSALSFQEKYGKYGAYFIGPESPAGQKTIYLTIDEGYENGYTVGMLDTLREKDVKAVFFLTSNYVKKNEALVQRMIDEGHTVGNHTVNHKNLPDCSDEEVVAEVMGLHDYVLEHFNYDMRLFRFPEGSFSERSLALLGNIGYTTLFWSFAYQDWDPKNQMGVEKAYPKLISSLHDREILLLHAAGSDNEAMLGAFIDEAKALGYTFAVLK